jgi:N-acetylmuramoyl-L-alanine amidase
MRWSSDPRSASVAFAACASLGVLLLLSVFLLSSPADQKRISIYSTAANYSLTVSERDGHDYVGLLEVLEPLGTVTARADGQRWRFRYNKAEGEFTGGKMRVRMGKRDFDLTGNFLLENGRGLVPLSSLGTLLPRILGGPVTFHEASRRLFIGNVAVHFTAQVNRANPPSLVMDFTAPVNPMIATEPGKVRLVFTREPLVPPGSATLTFDNKSIPSASYQENNGAAEISVTGSVPLFASFSNGGRTITITPAPQPTAVAPTQTAGQQPAGVTPASPPLQPGATPAGMSPGAPSQYFAVVDASHGGEERGAALADQLAEKDVTLAFAHRLKQELETRGLTTLMLREGDTTLGLDQRAMSVNKAHPAIYICIHGTSQGQGVRLYTAMLPAGGDNRGLFIDWDTAQTSSVSVSQTAAASLAGELQQKQVPVRTLAAPLRPLNNIAAAAVAVEVAPPDSGISGLTSPEYQQLVAGSIAAGVAAVRDKLGAGR